jgi:hypothetical protein
MDGLAKIIQDLGSTNLAYFSGYGCPNCAQRVNVEHQQDHLNELYYVRVKCNSCAFAGLGFVTYEAIRSMGFDTLITEVVKDIVSVDLIEQTERELEQELETDDVPF